MYLYYYIIDGVVRFTCCRGNVPGRLSPVWSIPSASAWLVPNTAKDEEDADELHVL